MLLKNEITSTGTGTTIRTAEIISELNALLDELCEINPMPANCKSKWAWATKVEYKLATEQYRK